MDLPPILIVDDEVDLLQLFKASLRNLPYPVLTAKDGEAALQILEEQIPILIILDIAMPYINGVDVLRQVRADSRFDQTKIIILTAAPSRISGTDAQLADLVVSKPITARNMEQTVRQLIDGVA